MAIPNLSQDFYRFIWDGRIILEGYNPYLNTVEYFISNNVFPVAQSIELREGMGTLNASHYSNYPPVNQLCFIITALASKANILGSVVTMRLLIIAADIGTLYFGKKLLQQLKIPVYNIFWYVLNPFIIIELTGNLHFEGVMIFFLVWSLYLLSKNKWQWAAVVFSLSISVKLIPLMLLPLFFQKLIQKPVLQPTVDKSSSIHAIKNTEPHKTDIIHGFSRLLMFYSIVGLTSVILFLPFYSPQFADNYIETVALWFQNFEFNASLYYVAREIGYLFSDYNQIKIIGKVIAITVFLFVIIIAFVRKNKSMVELISGMLIVLSFYYFTATTVHPWYIATLLILSVFTKYKFPLVWSAAIILSYLAYLNIGDANKSENLYIIALEYLIVYSAFIWEVFIKKAPVKEPEIAK
jgi:hypothetical protein